jgi:hypothetical protein
MPFQTHCYSENLVAPGIGPGTLGLSQINVRKSIYNDFLTQDSDLSKTPVKRIMKKDNEFVGCGAMELGRYPLTFMMNSLYSST